MAKQYEIYKCTVCGNVVEAIVNGSGEMYCCGKPMERLPEKTADVGKEKHVPVIEKTANGYKVKVGSVPHPMEEKHYIEWIEIIADDKAFRQYLKPVIAPEANFCIEAGKITARENCNIHGLWKG